jgi:predicted HAD superfamily Cof-like phosphohydrolase
MRATDDLVWEFHATPGSRQPLAKHPTIPSVELARHRLRLIEEEFDEVKEELERLIVGRLSPDEAMVVLGRLLKELCDLRYVADGTCVSLGLPYEEAYRAVHDANMSKRFDDGEFHTDERGKVLKGPNYRPPDMARLVPPIIDVEEA